MIINRNISLIKKILQFCEDIDEINNTHGDSFEVLQSDKSYKHSLALCTLQIGELAGHLTDDFKNEYDNISWQDMIRMRNIAVHHYTKFDLGHLWETIKNDIPELKLFCQNYLKQNDVPIEQPTSSPKFRP